ncbi:MAG: bifunctional hydroxymethylpyrimidine kinase/phosphomethylpyrimidine kinase [Chloroflexi bacterium]|nr:bifunctional hydroxymethylpyrimidine kinase/phosphomethylpyrimidine kinase [Chloroflexota bacterium]
MDEGYVLVIGSAGIDIKGRAEQEELRWETSNLGRVRNSVGGVARNIAENLTRLEVDTILLTAIGDDAEGARVQEHCRANRINCSYARVVEGARTGTYLALLKPSGELLLAIGDFEVMRSVDEAYLREHEHLLADAEMVVIDATLSQEALATVFEMAERHHVRVCADPTTPMLAPRLCPYIPQLHLVVPNAAETAALCGLAYTAHDRESATSAARQLVALGAYIAVVTMGDKGLAYADSSGGGFIRAIHTNVVDSTGAGDALTSAVIFGLLNEVPLDEAMRLGVTAASLTLQTTETVVPNLSQEMLYDQLVI